jgi:protein-S-isoprenylcysteine O-methyltransferase Ste14
MGRVVIFFYGVVAYGAFFVTILYAIGFLGGFVVPKTIDSGTAGPVGTAVLINVLLILLFGVQHTIMARPWFKNWWTRILPKPAERSTFVLAASALLALLMWQWRPMPTIVWQLDAAAGKALLWGLYFFGWFLVFYSSFLIDHFDLFGLRQVFLHLKSREYHHRPFMAHSLYKVIRHPLMAGFLVAAWATPTMTQGHLLFAAVITGYVFVGVRLEERDLVRFLGEDYRRYRERTPMLLPLPKRNAAPLSPVSMEARAASGPAKRADG